MSTLAESIKEKPALGWGLLIAVMVAVFLLGLLAASVTERRAEIASLYDKKVEITGIEPKSAIWGINYPREYATWKKTAEMDFKSKYLGNVVEDALETHPNMVVLWAGYAFSRDYNAPRGHMYTIADMRATLRVGAPGVPDGKEMQPGTCWTCKSPDVPRMMEKVGLDNYYKAKWSEWGSEIVNPLGCADCHDPKTMNLTITRPALVEVFARNGRDVKNASPQEMRSLVCAQCHVEYYFQGENKHLTFQWDKGTFPPNEVKALVTVEEIEAYYDDPSVNFKDFVNTLSKTPIIKAQHPGYETFMLGTHGQRGVSCADCHMPYISEGGVKYTDHQIMSPLKKVASTCQTCHRDSEANLVKYVYEKQDKVQEIRQRVEEELARAHIMGKFAWDAGATAEEMAPIQKVLRAAQWRWDFGVAAHGGPFHATAETERILAHALDKSMQAQLMLQKLLIAKGDADYAARIPDLAHWTKAEAQKFIGLNMEALRAPKAEFMKTIVPQWDAEAKQAGRLQ
ncbi:MAG: ammonia-forming cytochrome c nitrite reductase [Zoogloeaceae bacterium]|jgi:nitrite reductase (cytochrome c-552)|nr:ammonia-forming cytochrome c nitrite reductase [Zoogloeaceae bacterium]